MPKTLLVFGAASCIVFILGSPLKAQNAEPEAVDSAKADDSTVPYQPPISQTNQQTMPAYAGYVTPDEHPLTGVQSMSLSNSAETHNYVLPSMTATTQLNTGPGSPGYSGSSSFTYLLGHFDLYHTSYRSTLQMDYTGGEMLSTGGGSSNSPVQDLEFAETVRWQRWSLLMADEANYLSQSPFGYGGVGGLGYLGGISNLGLGGSLGGVTPFLDTSVVPNQTISTAWVPRVSNAVVSQLEYQLTQRSSWTITGSYGLLRFSDAGYVNSSDTGVQIGYNYQLSPISSVAILYRFDDFRFPGLPEGFNDDVAQLVYGRRLTDRLSFQAAAGPDLVIVRGEPVGSGKQYFWAANTSINYQFTKMIASASYDHLPTSGSGVLAGAYTDQILGTLQRSLFRRWNATASVGYARNRSIEPVNQGSSSGAFHSWYTAVEVSRPLGSGMTFFVAYEANFQGAATSGCSVSGCASGSIASEFTVGFNWFLRPTVLQ
jgi:hypothetical protein